MALAVGDANSGLNSCSPPLKRWATHRMEILKMKVGSKVERVIGSSTHHIVEEEPSVQDSSERKWRAPIRMAATVTADDRPTTPTSTAIMTGSNRSIAVRAAW